MCRLDNFELFGKPDEREHQARALELANDYAASIRERVDSGEGVVVYGPVGTGKDHLMVGLMYVAVGAGLTVQWVNGLDLYGQFRDRIDGEQSEAALVNSLASADVLAISDPVPPFGRVSDWQAATMFRIIDRRYRDLKPIFVTANLGSGREGEDRLGVAVVDRLRERATSIHCEWSSYRRGGG